MVDILCSLSLALACFSSFSSASRIPNSCSYVSCVVLHPVRCKIMQLSGFRLSHVGAALLVTVQSLAELPSSEPAKRVTKGLGPDLFWQEIGICQEIPQITTRSSNLCKLVERKREREIEQVRQHGRVVSARARMQGRRGDAQARQTTRTQSSEYSFTPGYVGTYSLACALALSLPHKTAPAKTSLDSSLKRHTALIKRAKQSIALEHRDQLLKDIDGLTLERYVDEIATAVIEGVARCRNDKDIWSATEVCPLPSPSTRRGKDRLTSWRAGHFRPPSTPQPGVRTEDCPALAAGPLPAPACRTRIRAARPRRGAGARDGGAGRAPAAAAACLCGACHGWHYR